jgi:hypothetical protein
MSTARDAYVPVGLMAITNESLYLLLLLLLSFFSFLGSTAQFRPWPLPQNPTEFLGGFSTIFFFTG